jgi:hypothetical protein
MTQADKELIILDLQCKVASWLTALNSSLGLLKCVDNYKSTLVQVTNFIKVLYRYDVFSKPVTNADVITISSVLPVTTQTINIDITYDKTILASYSGTNSIELIIQAICDEINLNTNTHGYYCIVINNSLYLYTYDDGYIFTDIPTITYTETGYPLVGLSVDSTNLAETDLSVILDTFNCITHDDFCTIYNKVKTLLSNCGC